MAIQETIDAFKKDWEKIYKGLQSQEKPIWNLQHKIIRHKINTEYLYWNKAKHYAKDFDLSEDELWALIKSTRISAYVVYLPIFSDTPNTHFSHHSLEIIQKKIYDIDTLLIEIEQVKQPEMDDLLDSYYIDGLIEEAYETSRIEGAQTKRDEAFDLIRLSKKPQDLHQQMIVNAFHTSKKWRKNTQPITQELIRDIHNDLIKLTKNNADEYDYRSGSVDIVDSQQNTFFRPIENHDQILESMKVLSKWIEEEHLQLNHFIHPLIKAILVHFWVAYIHPFYDGNGRTARMLFYLTLLREPRYKLMADIPISTTIRKTRKEYEKAFLYVEHDDILKQDYDLNYFVIYHLNVIHKSLQEFYTHIKKTQELLQRLSQQLHAFKLNWRQIALYHYAQKHPKKVFTISSYCLAHNITRITSTKDLENLVQHNLFVESKPGKIRYFSINKTLSSETP